MTQILDGVDIGTQHHFSDGLYAKQMMLPKGYVATSHKHAYDHLSILAKGRAAVACNGLVTLYDAPACIHIAAGVEHKIEALDDIAWFCIHATDETDADHIDDVLIAKE